MKKLVLTALFLALVFSASAKKKFKWSMIDVPEEGGISFVQITRDGSNVSGPAFDLFGWYTGRMLDVSPNGEKILYIDYKNKTRNVYVKSTSSAGAAVQRTFRTGVNCASFSPDGKEIVFNESRDGKYIINTTKAEGGNLLQQITDNGGFPSYSSDGKTIFFSRADGYNTATKKVFKVPNYGVWSYDRSNGLMTNYSSGRNPQPLKDRNSFICERINDKGYSEIWLVDCDGGSESLILSEPGKSFTTPSISPDGKWILVIANSSSNGKIVSSGKGKKEKIFLYNSKKQNTDIYVVRTDGSQLTQLTYHKGNDCSPTWSPDGKYIYFLSQRGSESGDYNVWRMNFTL